MERLCTLAFALLEEEDFLADWGVVSFRPHSSLLLPPLLPLSFLTLLLLADSSVVGGFWVVEGLERVWKG